MSDFDNIQFLAEEFENETLQKSSWTHEAHLAVGLYYVLNLGTEDALNKIRINIQKYNLATGGENTETAGYHETITRFWIWAIDQFLCSTDKKLSTEELFNQLITSRYSNKNFPFEYYTKDFLLSTHARLNYAEPDLQFME